MKKLFKGIVLCFGLILIWSAFSIQSRAAEQTNILNIITGSSSSGGGDYTVSSTSSYTRYAEIYDTYTSGGLTYYVHGIFTGVTGSYYYAGTTWTNLDGTPGNDGVYPQSRTFTTTTWSLTPGVSSTTVEGTLHIDESTTDYVQSVDLSAYVTNVGDISIVGYSWNTGETTQDITVTSNGTYTVTLTYIDTGVTRTKDLSIDISNVDTTPPVLSSTYDDTGDMVAYVDLEVTILDTLSGLPIESLSFENQENWTSDTVFRVTENGTYTIYGRDIAGNIGSIDVTVTRVDESPPVFTTNYSKGGACKSVSFDILAVDDESGLPAEAYSLGNQTNWTSQTHYSFTSNGTYVFYARDNAGNISSLTISISEIDNDAPILSVEYDNTTFTRGVTVTVSAIDYGYGVSSEAFRFNGSEIWTASNSFYATANGTYTIEGRDYGGNSSKISFEINVIDTTGPFVTLTYDNSVYVQEGLLNAGAVDYQAGISGLVFNSETTWGTSASYTITENGIYTVSAYDVLGNGGIATVEVTNIDKTVPTISTSFVNGEYIPYADIQIIASDDLSGLPTDAYSFGNQTNWTDDNIFRVTENGTYIVYVRDCAGNIGSIDVLVDSIDNTPPTISFETYEFGDHTELIVLAADNESGLPAEAYSFDQGETWIASYEVNNIIENGEYTIQVKDYCGNIAVKTITLDNVEHAIHIYEEEMATMATITVGSSASTSTTGFLFFMASWLFSSAAIYAKDEKGRYKLLGKCRIIKHRGKYEIRINKRLELKMKRNHITEIKVICSPFFKKNMKNKNIELCYKKKKIYVTPGKETSIKLVD